MAFFTVLGPGETTGDGDFEVERCHVNIWSLPGLFGHRPMLFDVGLLIRPTSPVTAIEMAIPVKAAPRVINLSQVVLHNEVGPLLFGNAYQGSRTPNTITLLQRGSETTFEVVAVKEKESTAKADEGEVSVVRLALHSALAPDALSYVRVRLTVDDPGSMWRWQRVLGRRNGALVDFRVADSRDSQWDSHKALLKRSKTIPELDVFAMLPDRYQLGVHNPALRYTRTLEGEIWQSYLRRALYGFTGKVNGRQRLMVHRWHVLADDGREPISKDNPLRGFLQFNREPGFRATSDHLLVAVLTASVFYALFRPVSLRAGIIDAGNAIGDAAGAIASLGVGVVAAAGFVAVVGILWAIARKLTQRPRAPRQIKRGFKRYLEYKWFKLLGVRGR